MRLTGLGKYPYNKYLMPKTRAKVGPHSQRLALGSIDGRGLIARRMKALRAELTAAIGGAPTPQQRLLIEGVAIRLTRIRMIWAQMVEDPAAVAEETERRMTWYLNGLRRDLVALGLEGPKATPTTRDLLVALEAAE